MTSSVSLARRVLVRLPVAGAEGRFASILGTGAGYRVSTDSPAVAALGIGDGWTCGLHVEHEKLSDAAADLAARTGAARPAVMHAVRTEIDRLENARDARKAALCADEIVVSKDGGGPVTWNKDSGAFSSEASTLGWTPDSAPVRLCSARTGDVRAFSLVRAFHRDGETTHWLLRSGDGIDLLIFND